MQYLAAGASLVIDDSCRDFELREAIGKTVRDDQRIWPLCTRFNELRERVAKLTGREMQILDLMTQGHAIKKIAVLLDVSPRTIEARRKKMFTKMGTSSPIQAACLLTEYRAFQNVQGCLKNAHG